MLVRHGRRHGGQPAADVELLREEMPALSIDIGSTPGVLLSRKEDIDFALRHTGIFSSNVDAVDLKNKRPMIRSRSIRRSTSFRKLLDPIFAPAKSTPWTGRSVLVYHLIDGFIHRGESTWPKEFFVPFPSGCFLTLLGLPMEELDTFLTMKDGIIRAEHVVGTRRGRRRLRAYRDKIDDSVYENFNNVLDGA